MEVLLYSDIQSWTAADFINQVNQSDDDNITIRVNCDGGEVMYGWGIIAKFQEFDGEKKVKIDGKARSMAAFLPCYADEVSALDISSFTFHRAAYPEWAEKEMSEEMRSELLRVNKHLEKAFRSKVDISAFETVTGVTVKDLFSMDSRIDVSLDAIQAKKVGLINEIVNITPKKKEQIEARTLAIAAKFGDKASFKPAEIVAEKTNINKNSKIRKMTIEQFKAENPEVFAQAVSIGISQEKDRVGAWAVFNGIDPEAVVAGIKSGENISETAKAEFSLKAMVKPQVEALETESTKKVETEKKEDVELTESQKIEAQAMALVTNQEIK
jgi:ATP-dependent protease ClpP protease subunit